MKHSKISYLYVVFLLYTIGGIATAQPKKYSLHEAAEKGDIEKVKSLLEEDIDINTKDGRDRAPLHYAVVNDHKDIAQLLISKGANINIKSEDNFWAGHMNYGRASRLVWPGVPATAPIWRLCCNIPYGSGGICTTGPGCITRCWTKHLRWRWA